MHVRKSMSTVVHGSGKCMYVIPLVPTANPSTKHFGRQQAPNLPISNALRIFLGAPQPHCHTYIPKPKRHVRCQVGCSKVANHTIQTKAKCRLLPSCAHLCPKKLICSNCFYQFSETPLLHVHFDLRMVACFTMGFSYVPSLRQDLPLALSTS